MIVDMLTVMDNLSPIATLPVVSLPGGVVFPGAIVTIALDTEDARTALAAGVSTDNQVLLVPQLEGRHATVGTIAKIENVGELPNGQHAAVLRGLQRARIGAYLGQAIASRNTGE